MKRIAHELWDYAELKDKHTLSANDAKTVINKLVIGQSTYYELRWEQLPPGQRALIGPSHGQFGNCDHFRFGHETIAAARQHYTCFRIQVAVPKNVADPRNKTPAAAVSTL